MLLADSITKCRIRGYSGRTEYSLFILPVLQGGAAMDNSKKNIYGKRACYGRAAYRKGFHDCVSLLQEMGLSPSGAANSAKNARQTLKPKKIMTP